MLTQSEQRLEILVVDDASSDATASLVEAAAARDGRIRLLRTERNGGPGAARNVGLAHASGEWIAPLDADDRFLPNRLARLVDLGERRQADMVADNLLVSARPGPAANRAMFPPGFMPDGLLLDARGFVQGNMTRAAAGRIGYAFLKPLIRGAFLARHEITYDETRFAEDYLLYLRCLLHGARWALTTEALYEYTVAATSLTDTHSAGDLAFLADAEAAMLHNPSVARDPALRRTMARPERSVRRTLSWCSVATAIKRRDWPGLLPSLGGDPRNALHVGRQGLHALPRAWRKRRARAAR